MRSLQLADRLSNAVVQKNLMDSRNTINRTRWQIIYLIQIGNIHSAELLSRLVDLSVHSIYEIVGHYNHSGIEALSCEPSVAKQMIREYIYVYSALSPQSGNCYSMTSPYCNTDAMNEFLLQLGGVL